MKHALWLAALLTLLTGCLAERPASLVKVGLLAPLEGERRTPGYHLLPAARAAMSATVHGQPVEWVILDTGSDPAVAAQRARELLVDPAVVAVIGPLLPQEVAAVKPLMVEAGVAWWPLAPAGDVGLAAWRGDLEGAAWGPELWPAIRRGEVSCYLDPVLPDELGDFAAVAGTPPWPQDWLTWQATSLAAQALEAAPTLSRAEVARTMQPMTIPPAARYCSAERAFPGTVQSETTP